MQAFYSHLSKQLGYYASVLLSEGGLNLMFVTNYAKEERMAIVMECRKSGLTDALWCKQHDIPVGTFYSWVKNFSKHSNMSAHHKENPHSNGLLRYLLKNVH